MSTDSQGAGQAPAGPSSTSVQAPASVGVAPASGPGPSSAEIGLAVAVAPGSESGVVTARRAGALRDVELDVNPARAGVPAALQNLAKAVNIAFQTDFGENSLESVYQAAVVLKGEMRIIHREYFGFRDTWFGQFGRLLRSLKLTLQGPDPASPEGQKRIAEKGPATIRGLLNLIGRKLDLVTEYEARVPAFVEQMFDRLEASGIIVGWDRDCWTIKTTKIGLDIRMAPRRVTAASIGSPSSEAEFGPGERGCEP